MAVQGDISNISLLPSRAAGITLVSTRQPFYNIAWHMPFKIEGFHELILEELSI